MSAAEEAGIDLRQRTWTQHRIIVAIQDCYVEGLPIHIAGFGKVGLAAAAKKRFGSWHDAVAAAGLAGKLPSPKIIRTWSKEAVLETVLTRHRQGFRLAKTYEDDSGFYSAAKKYFGSWTNTLLAAGLPPTRKQWTKDRVVEEIQVWRLQGVAISSISSQDQRLTVAAIRLFGNWYNALVAAGLDAKPRNRKRRSAANTTLQAPTVIVPDAKKDAFPITKKGRTPCHAKPSSAASSSARCRNVR